MTLQKDPEGNERKILHKYADFVDKRVLEVGCGDGRLTRKYASSAKQVAGLDVEFDDLRLARADCPYDIQKKVGFAQASALGIPFPAESFDVGVLAWSL